MEAQTGETETVIIPEEISKRITSLRFLLIVLVVFIHANLKVDVALNYYHYDFIQPKWIEVFKNFVRNTLGCAAVPLFFLFASYLQFSKDDKYSVLLRKRSKSLLLPYVLWTAITIVLYFVAQSIPQTAPFFMNPINIVRNWNGLDWIKVFTYHNLAEDFKNPLVYQFWFLRDLMIFILLSPLLKFLCEKFAGGMLIVISIIALKEIPVFFTVSSGALFFYMAGFYFARYKISFFEMADKIKIIEYVLLLILSVVFDLLFDGKYSFGFLGTIISCLFFLKLSVYFVKSQKIYNRLEYLAGYSFFLYAIHTPFLGTSINKISQKIIPLHGILCLVQFLLAGFLTIVLGTMTGILLNKICPKLFRVLNGGRK
ncbi:MAG: acyltransferase [Treponema sp.]|nr:acyltransferase [Treponema sp.]